MYKVDLSCRYIRNGYEINECKVNENGSHISPRHLPGKPFSLLDMQLNEFDKRITFPFGSGLGKDAMVSRFISYFPIPILAGISDVTDAFVQIKLTFQNKIVATTETVGLLADHEGMKHIHNLEPLFPNKNMRRIYILKSISPLDLTKTQKIKIIALSIATLVRGLIESLCLGFLFIGPDILFDKIVIRPYFKPKNEKLQAQINQLAVHIHA